MSNAVDRAFLERMAKKLGMTPEDINSNVAKATAEEAPVHVKANLEDNSVQPKKVRHPRKSRHVRTFLPQVSNPPIPADKFLTIKGTGSLWPHEPETEEKSSVPLKAGTYTLETVPGTKVPFLAIKGFNKDGKWGFTVSELVGMRLRLPKGIDEVLF